MDFLSCRDTKDAPKVGAGKELSTVSVLKVNEVNLSTLLSVSLQVSLDVVMHPPAVNIECKGLGSGGIIVDLGLQARR